VILAFVISGVLAATAGLILLGQVASAQPTVGVGDEMYAVGAVLIGGASVNGGMGNVGKTVAGVLILGLISDGINLLSINAFIAYIVQGGVILLAILLDQWERKGRR
jgi:ribose transport system permease protein